MKKVILFSMVLCVFALTPAAHADVWGDYEYTDNGDDTCTITDYNGPGGDITIPDTLPDTLDGLTVTSIGSNAFFDRRPDHLTSITIPDSVTSILSSAFVHCTGLTSIIIPDSVTSIERSAFAYCTGLTSVTIGNGVTSIGDRAFGSCTGLAAIIVDVANPAYSSINGVLLNKDQTLLVQFPGGKAGAYTMPDSVITIGNFAFYKSSLTSVTIGNGVTTIGSGAFQDCSGLTSVTIPNSVTYIQYYAFSYCTGLKCVYFKGNRPGIYVHVFRDVNATVYYLPEATGWGSTFDGLPTAVWVPSIADVNIDAAVNFADFAVFAAAWLAVSGVDDEHDPLCDISDPVDGVIDAADLVVFTDNWLITPCILSIADVDMDGDVNFADFSVFAAAWLATSGDAAYNPLCDISDPVDGVIDAADLVVFADNWMITPCP